MPDTDKAAADNSLAAAVHNPDSLNTAGALSTVQSADSAGVGVAYAPIARRKRKLDHCAGGSMSTGRSMSTGIFQSADSAVAYAPIARRKRNLDNFAGRGMSTGIFQSEDSADSEAACAPIAGGKRKPDHRTDMSMSTSVYSIRLASMALTRIRRMAGPAEQDSLHAHIS